MKLTKKWAIRFLVVAVALVAGFTFLLRHTKNQRHVLQGRPPNVLANNVAPTLSDIAMSEDGRSNPSRKPICRVTDENGVPLVDVRIKWIARQPQEGPQHSEKEWSAETLSESDGTWEFGEQPPVGSQCSVFTFSHSDYMGAVVVQPSLLELSPDIQHVVLKKSSPKSVLVVNASGAAVEGAIVYQVVSGVGVGDKSGVETGNCEPVMNTFVTDSAGVAVIDPLPGKNCLWARSAELVSSRWEGQLRDAITLVLVPTFSAEGRVIAAAGTELTRPLHVKCSVPIGQAELILGSVIVDSSANWKLEGLPIVSAGRYSFWLEGERIVRDERHVIAPDPGTQCRLDLVQRRGYALSVAIEDKRGNRLDAATVVARWMNEGDWVSTSEVTGRDGHAVIDGIPPTVVYLSASRPGFVDGALDPLTVSDNLVSPIVIELAAAAILEGRCLWDGKPVESFEVLWWTDPHSTKSREMCELAPEGWFRVDRMPVGEVSVMAIAEGLGQTESVTVNIEPGELQQVELEFLGKASGVGEVVDALTMSPVPYPLIQVYTNSRGMRIEKRGLQQGGSAVGRFSIEGLTYGINLISVEAEGYSPRSVLGMCSDNSVVDFGIVPLKRRRPAEIQLSGRRDAEWTSFVCEIAGEQSIADRKFPPSGLLKYEALDVGAYVARIIYPGQSTYRDVAFRLGPWWSRRVEVPVYSQSMNVSIVPASGQPMPIDHVICVQSGLGDNRSSRQFYAVSPNGSTQVEWAPGPLVVTVESWSGDIVGMKSIVNASPSSVVEVQLSECVSPVFRVVGPSGDPLPGVTVLACDSNAHTGWYQYQLSDKDGMCRFGSIDLGEILVLMHRYPDGTMSGQRLSLPKKDEIRELIFDPDWSLSVLVKERSTEMPGIELAAQDPDGRRVMPRAVTDAGGLAVIGRVSGDDWMVRVDHPGLWPTEMTIDSQHPKPVTIQTRRIGGLHLTVLRGNVVAPNVPIELIYVETGERVEAWIESGKLSSECVLRSGADGVVQIDGIPNGSYVWRVIGTGGESQEGSVSVPAQARAYESIDVP